MFSQDKVLQQAIATIEMEADSVAKLKSYINENFVETVKIIHESKGRVVVTGIGKSAIIAQKIVATFNSTGTPSLFMHAADAIHGDLGMVQPDDVVIIISKSGESPEIKLLIPFIRNFGNPVVALCGNENSYLAKQADYFINSTVAQEACPNNLAPTTSTTAQMVMGDALAVCLLSLKGFSSNDFARFHPGGALGKRLYMRVSDLSKSSGRPAVNMDSSVQDVIFEITSNRLGATAVLDEKGSIRGIITDGDIRRMLEKHGDTRALKAKDILSENPKSVEEGELAVNAFELMRQHDIMQVIVTNKGEYTAMLHLHDMVKEGLI